MKKLSVLLILLMCMLLCSCGNKENGTAAYAYVNGEAITQNEIDFYTSRSRSDIIREFSSEYDISDFSVFWETKYDGVTPQEALEDRALRNAAEAKIKFTEMKKYGIYSDVTWDYFREKALEYNESHSGAQTVGLKSIDMEKFYTYYLSTGEIELKKSLLADGISDYDGYIASLLEKAEITRSVAETEP